jgi:hypothetical protein
MDKSLTTQPIVVVNTANASNFLQLRSAGQRFCEEFGGQGRRFPFAGNAVFSGKEKGQEKGSGVFSGDEKGSGVFSVDGEGAERRRPTSSVEKL